MANLRRYQRGSLTLNAGIKGHCWYIRFRCRDGSRPRFRVGSEHDYPTRELASCAAEAIRSKFNSDGRERLEWTLGDVVERYELEEMPSRYATRNCYQNIIDRYVVPRWAKTPLSDLDPVEVRGWLRTLSLAPRTKGHILDLMRRLYKFAMFWRWVQPTINPLTTFSVPGCSKRTRKPRVITPTQFPILYRAMPTQQSRLMLVGCYFLGLRISELLGLKWKDFEILPDCVFIQRSVVDGQVSSTKTYHSDSALPLDPFVAGEFMAYRRSVLSSGSEDWVFAYSGDPLAVPNQRRVQYEILRRQGESIGLSFNLGWHSLRHSYKTLLDLVAAEPAVQRDLMRHADIRTTLQHYGETHFSRLREANAKAVLLALTGVPLGRSPERGGVEAMQIGSEEDPQRRDTALCSRG